MRRRGFDLSDRPQPIIAQTIDISLNLREDGMSMRKISEEVGYSVRQIQRWLNLGVAG
jgi:lambda repressor-like predicted transcriptional regulator